MGTEAAAIICLAGKSVRMGDHKPLLPFAGTTVISSLVKVFKTAGVKSIVLVTGRDAACVEQEMKSQDVHIVHNPDFESTDMFASVKIGLEAATNLADVFFITPGDAVLFLPETVAAMLEEIKQTKNDVVVPAFADERGHPVLISRPVCSSALAYSGENGLRGVLTGFQDKTSVLETDDFGILFDMDYPEDYEQAKRLEAGRRQGQFGDLNISMAKTALRAAAKLEKTEIKVSKRAVISQALFNQDNPEPHSEIIKWQKKLMNEESTSSELKQCIEQMTGSDIQKIVR